LRQVSVNPALREENTSVPVTPGIYNAEHNDQNPYEKAFNTAPPDSNNSSGTAGPQWNANGKALDQEPNGRRPTSPTEAADGVRSGEELLRRLSLTGQRPQHPDLADVDPRAAHPNLHLSGHVISATFCVPYKINYAPGADWVCHA